MIQTLNLAAGDHEASMSAVDWSPSYVYGTHPALVELIASFESEPRAQFAPSRGSTATTLALRMDARVAIELYGTLGELGRSMGWLPQL